MVEHLVFLKLKNDISEDDYHRIISSLKELPSKMDVIKRLKVGRNFSQRNQGYGIGLSVTLDDEASLKIYRDHPEHVEVLEKLIKPCLEDVIAIDFVD